MIKNSFEYRNDIDGLRAISIIGVLLFHLRYLKNGYLGVDIFFVISGYLITKIILNDIKNNVFTVGDFYQRRIRRILPLILISSVVSLILGYFFMLPDDFENLSQSVFATSLFSNNFLLLKTTHDYWDVSNNYKPLMHTWSLAIEEQFYLIYPLIIFFFGNQNQKKLMIFFVIITLISINLFIFSDSSNQKFYQIQYRIFEFTFGILGAFYFKNEIKNIFLSTISTFIIFLVLFYDCNLNSDIKLITINIASLTFLITLKDGVLRKLFDNKIIGFLGKISFSIYVWHQIILAFLRYCLIDKLDLYQNILVILFIFFISICSYFFIEKPFRNQYQTSLKNLYFTTGALFFISILFSFYFYKIGGIVRDIPELNILSSESKYNSLNSLKNIHNEYNSRNNELDKEFVSNDKIKILVIGDSYGRDFINILLESKFRDLFEISFLRNFDEINKDLRIKKADKIFFVFRLYSNFESLINKTASDKKTLMSKIKIVGTKSFGYSNGIIYNKIRDSNYCSQKVVIENEYFDLNAKLKTKWLNKYIDLLELVSDKNGNVRVFTENCKFISHDTRHLTKEGAIFFSTKLDLNQILNLNSPN